MRRCVEMVCAGVLMLAAVGCMGDSFLGRQIVVYGPMVLVNGSVGEVSAKLRDGLSEAGLLLNAKWVGSDYRISSTWKSHTVFCLHMKQMKDKVASHGLKTQVRIQWDRGGDEELWQLVLKILNAPADAPSEETVVH
jgi:hypothetical protein